MNWILYENWQGVAIYEAVAANGVKLNQYKILGGEPTALEEARKQAYASKVTLEPEAPVKKTGGIKR